MQTETRLPLWLRVLEWIAWCAFFALVAVFLALRYWLLPHIEDYRAEIVSVISRSIGLPVRIGTIRADWEGLRPRLDFTDVRIYDSAGRSVLVLPQVWNVVSWRSLLFLDLRLHSLTVEGPQLTVRRDAKGNIYIAGMQLSGAAPRAQGGLADWVLDQREIVVHKAEIEWRDEMRGAPPLALHALDFRLRNSGERHLIGLSASPPKGLGTHLDLRAELSGASIATLARWRGEIYAEIGYTNLAGWRPWVDYPVELQRGQGALRLWVTLGGGKLTQSTADVALTDVAMRLGPKLPLLELQSVRGRVQSRLSAQGYLLAGEHLALVRAQGAPMSPLDIRIGWQPASGSTPEHGMASAPLVQLEPLAQLASYLPLPSSLRELLGELSPRGDLRDFKFSWSGPLADAGRYGVKARFSGVAVNAWHKVPGFSGLSGRLDASTDGGHVYLASRKTELDLPQVFPQRKVELDTLNGRIDWEHPRPGAIDVQLGALKFSSPHFAGDASGTYSWHDGDGPGTIDLTAHLSRADGSQVARYLPLGSLMGEKPRKWVAGAVVSGRATKIRLRLQGDLRDFPYADSSKGRFEVSAHFSDGVFQPGPKWPRIADIDGELNFNRDRMTITGDAGSVFGAKLSDVRVGIESMTAPQKLLEISGTAEGPSGAFLRYVAASPVHGMVKGLTDTMHATGRGTLKLKLELPLGKLEHSKVAGDFRFADNGITLIPHLPPIEHAHGAIGFTESALKVRDVRGRLLGGEVRINGDSAPGAGLQLRATGRAQAAALEALVPQKWRGFLSGGADYAVTATMRDGSPQLRLESSLRGMASSLPAPLEKAAARELPLRVELLPGAGDARDRISVKLGQRVAAEILRQRTGPKLVVQRIAIALGPQRGQAMRVPARPGVLVYGALPHLELGRWLPLLSGSGGDAAQTAIDLKADTLDAFGRRISGVALKADVGAKGWSATVLADELAGKLDYQPGAGGKLVARLARFRIPGLAPGHQAGVAQEAKDLPALDLSAEHFTFRGKALGRVAVVANHAGTKWRIERISMTSPDASMSGSGAWSDGSAPLTDLTFELKTSNIGKFLDRIGYKGLMRDGKATLGGSVSWNGDPLTIDYPSLTGALTLDAKDGRFLEIQPGFGKLISLMSLQMLPRRITLDFRDVFSKGFQFERIHSKLSIRNGMMSTDDFKMEGAAANVSMSGQTDLANETQDLNVRVVPGLGDSSSTVIGLVNPLAGLASAIAQRLLKNPLGQIFAYDYKITGTWSDPKVEKVRKSAQPVGGELSGGG